MSKIVPIMGIPFTVTDPVKVDKKDKHVGESEGSARTIKVKKSLTPEVKTATLIHEILHSILYVSGQSERLTEEQEEALVLALEHGIVQVMELKEEYRW